MSEPDLRAQIKEMLVKNLMLQVTPEQIGDNLPLFGPDGLGLDSIDALELVVSLEKTFGVGVPNLDLYGANVQLERPLDLSATLFLWNSTEPRALHYRPNRHQKSRIGV